jgi:hypothetical protein
MVAVLFPATLVNTYEKTRDYNRGDHNPHFHRRGNLRLLFVILFYHHLNSGSNDRLY